MIFWQNLLTKLQDQQKVYVLTVIQNSGSSPGRKGFKMLVAQDGFIFGSIGGGVMEFKLVEEAQAHLLDKKPPIFIKKQIHRGHIKNGSGMICSGEQTVAFHCVESEHVPIVEKIMICLKEGKKGTLNLTPEMFSFSLDPIEQEFDCQINSEGDWFFKKHIGFREIIYIIGGGHVGVAVSALFKKLGFYVIVMDNRKDLNTFKNNEFAHQKFVINYNDISSYLIQGDNSYVAIMTNKFIDDKFVLSQIIRNKYNFIGVLGSKAKLKTMWKEMLQEGYTRNELAMVNAPIGLAIKSQTPEEIAVSIAAQVIALKNQDRK